MPNDTEKTTTAPTPTYGSGYYPGRSFAGYPGAYPSWGGRSFAGYPGAYGVGAWNGLRRSQLGYGYPGWNGVSGWNGAFNPHVNNAV